MKLKRILICLLALALLTACAPAVEENNTQEPTPNVTTPSPTIPPKLDDKQEEAMFTYMLEGEEYTVPAIRYHSDRGYSMIFDPSIMTFENNNQYDQFIVKAYDGLPAIQIRITIEDRTAESLESYLKTIGAELTETVELDGCAAKVLYYSEGDAYDDVVKTYYVVQAGDTVYLIENSYYQEAAEGYGSRMSQMVNTIDFNAVSKEPDTPETTDAPEVTEKPVAKELKIMVRDREVADFTSVIGETTTLCAVIDGETAADDLQWTSSNESICTVTVNDDGSCDVKIKGEGAAKVSVICGDLSASTVVRGKKSW